MKAMKWVAAVLLVALVGCTEPRNERLPDDVAEAQKLSSKLDKLPEEDRRLLAAYLMRREMLKAMGGGAGTAKTVGEAIDDQRRFSAAQEAKAADESAKEAERKALHDKLAASRADAVKLMNGVCAVSLTAKTVRPKDARAGRFTESVDIAVAFNNTTTWDLTGVKGRLHFKDSFGDEIYAFDVKVDDLIAAGATYVWNGTHDTNQFMADDTKFANTPQEKLRLVWEPKHFLFKDGRSVQMPDETRR